MSNESSAIYPFDLTCSCLLLLAVVGAACLCCWLLSCGNFWIVSGSKYFHECITQPITMIRVMRENIHPIWKLWSQLPIQRLENTWTSSISGLLVNLFESVIGESGWLLVPLVPGSGTNHFRFMIPISWFQCGISENQQESSPPIPDSPISDLNTDHYTFFQCNPDTLRSRLIFLFLRFRDNRWRRGDHIAETLV